MVGIGCVSGRRAFKKIYFFCMGVLDEAGIVLKEERNRKT
jgi:hypothetical protein